MGSLDLIQRSAWIVVVVGLAVGSASVVGRAQPTGEALPPLVRRTTPATLAPNPEAMRTTTTTTTTTTTPPTSTTRPPPEPPRPAPDQSTLDTVTLVLEPIGTLDTPTAYAARPGDRGHYVAERGGRIRRIAPDASVSVVLDVSDDTLTAGEGGVFDLVFSPDGSTLYVSRLDGAQRLRVAAYPMDGTVAQRGAGRDVLVLDEPTTVHNGGALAVTPEGLLFVSTGDGGPGGDPADRGQSTATLHGKILRIDPRGELPPGVGYTIPGGNPFADDPSHHREIWSYGLRNPWKLSFDSATGDLWVGDVGQFQVEEINHVPAAAGAGFGINFGWRRWEGDQRFDELPEPANHTPPTLTYRHQGRCAVIAGHVYRGRRVDAMRGAFVYGDLCDGVVRAVSVRDGQVIATRDLGVSVGQLVGFGVDAAGELYVVSLQGMVARLVPRV